MKVELVPRQSVTELSDRWLGPTTSPAGVAFHFVVNAQHRPRPSIFASERLAVVKRAAEQIGEIQFKVAADQATPFPPLRYCPPGKPKASGSPHTPQQREVLQLISEGQTTKEIAAALKISAKSCRVPSGPALPSTRLAYGCGVDPLCATAWHFQSLTNVFIDKALPPASSGRATLEAAILEREMSY